LEIPSSGSSCSMSGQSDVPLTSSTPSEPSLQQAGQARLDFELLQAVKDGTAREAEELIQKGANVNQVEELKDWTLLFHACERKQAPIGGRISLLKVLVLKHGLDPARVEGALGRLGQTPLFYAAREGDRAACEFLIEQNSPVDFVDRLEQTPLYWAAKHGGLDTAELLIEQRASVERKDKQGESPLFYAAKGGHVSVMELLLRNRAFSRSINYRNQTCLFDAHKDAVHCAVNARCDPRHRDMDNRTAMFPAAAAGDAEKIDTLMELGAKINEVDCYGSTCLFDAATKGHLAVISRLCDKHGADACIRNKEGSTARFQAESHGMKQVAAALQKAEIRQKKAAEMKLKKKAAGDKALDDHQGLYDIVWNGTVEQVAAALAAGVVWNTVMQHNGQNLVFAVACRSPPFDAVQCCELLCQGQGPVDLDLVDGQWQQTPLFFAVREEPEGAGPKLVRFLLERRCDPLRRDFNGHRPLHYAAKRQDPACVELLLEFRAQVDPVDNMGCTPVTFAAGMGKSLESTRALLRAKADVSHQDDMHRNAMFYASTVPIAELLLEWRCSLETQDKDGRTCLFMQVHMVQMKMVKLLIDRRADVHHADSTGETCLFGAASIKDEKEAAEMVKLLVEKAGANPNLVNLRGDAPGVQEKNAQIRKLILEYGASRGSPSESEVTFNTDVSKKRRLTRKNSAAAWDSQRRKLYQIVIQDQDGRKLKPGMLGYEDRLNEMLKHIPWVDRWSNT